MLPLLPINLSYACKNISMKPIIQQVVLLSFYSEEASCKLKLEQKDSAELQKYCVRCKTRGIFLH
jgi:hypothetical protein